MNAATQAFATTGLCLCTSALAGLSQSSVTAPGGLAQACAGPQTPGNNPWPGDDFASYHTAAGSDVDEGLFAGNSSDSRSASYSAANYSSSSSGTAAMGVVVGDAHNDAPNNSLFAQADFNGGWKDTFLIANAAYTGQTGYLVFKLHVTGSLAAAKFAGSANLRVAGYKDNARLATNAFFDKGNSDVLGTTWQYGNWALSTGNVNETKNKSVNGVVTFSCPFTFGTTFNLGIYGLARAGMRSASGVAGNSTADAILTKLNWGGIVGVYVDGSPVSGSAVSSGTGINWGLPIGNCPGDLNGDGFVDDSDFVLFVVAYNLLDCADPSMPAGCPSDLTGDGFVDDADFVQFVFAYNNLICP
ncbi:MAG: hypothetical protein KF691_00765 [Phycisphaeraceae bacterium]|nr:hypothetical protein [Phycisphaeraceae bacterium]